MLEKYEHLAKASDFEPRDENNRSYCASLGDFVSIGDAEWDIVQSMNPGATVVAHRFTLLGFTALGPNFKWEIPDGSLTRKA